MKTCSIFGLTGDGEARSLLEGVVAAIIDRRVALGKTLTLGRAVATLRCRILPEDTALGPWSGACGIAVCADLPEVFSAFPTRHIIVGFVVVDRGDGDEQSCFARRRHRVCRPLPATCCSSPYGLGVSFSACRWCAMLRSRKRG